MSRPTPESLPSVRQEIAARAARLIAEDGLDYASAKRKALRELVGNPRGLPDLVPDNEEIADEVRIYQQLFQADSQPERLAVLRRGALALLQLLADFQPWLIGAVCNGTAGEHSDIHLNLYPDSEKDVELFLLDQGIDFDTSGTDGEAGGAAGRGAIEVLSFLWSPAPRRVAAEAVHLHIYSPKALRQLPAERASATDVATWLSAPAGNPAGNPASNPAGATPDRADRANDPEATEVTRPVRSGFHS